MLLLTKVFLYNWHRFHRIVLDVHDSLYLTGVNGSGKSTILDAMQTVLIADLNRIAYNFSAQERTTRNLDTYVRGKQGENKWLRPGKTMGYIALEFTNSEKENDQLTLGIAIEAAPDRPPERLYFILSEPLDDNLFFSSGDQPLTRRELRKAFNARRGGRTFDNVGDYITDMLERVGGLNEKLFPDLFMRAYKFQPITNVTDFVKRWLLPERPLDVASLKSVQERLRDLELHRRHVVEKLEDLDRILEKQNQAREWRRHRDAYVLLGTFLTHARDERALADRSEREQQRVRQIEQGNKELAELNATWEGARHALEEVRFQLRQSDVMQHREILLREVKTARDQLARLHLVWDQLHADLARMAASLEPLATSGSLQPEEQQAVSDWISAVGELPAQPLPLNGFVDRTSRALAALEAGTERLRGDKARLDFQLDEARAKEKNVGQDLALLHQRQITYPPEVEYLRDAIAAEIGARPPLLCQVLQVKEEQWQNAVEALAGKNRFALVVPPEQFESSLRILESARASARAFGVRLLDLERAGREARPALAGSLAEKIETGDSRVRAYVDSILGDVITCSSPEELRSGEHRRAVTPQVLYYSGWVVEAISPRQYQPWFIGVRAQVSQLEMRERELVEIRERRTALEGSLREVREQLGRFGRAQELQRLAHRLETRFDERPLVAQIEEDERTLAEMDISGVQAMEEESHRLEQSAAEISARRDALHQSVGKWENDLETLRQEQARLRIRIEELELQENEQRARYVESLAEAEALFAEQRGSANPDEAIRQITATASDYESRSNGASRAYTQEGSTYNTRYRFAGDPVNPEETRYAEERERLNATELPSYKEKIEEARREADEELREHVLHRLRENIQQARADLARINAALEGSQFNGETYRFVHRLTEATRGFHDLIQGSQFLGPGTLMDNPFYREHQAEYDEFYHLLIRDASTEAERAEQDLLSDYRNYLEYDIVVTHADGTQSNWSKIMGQTSGGESQTPFYLTIAASFSQLYHINEPNRRPTMRLVIFDEAFAKMDQGRSSAALDIFQRFGLQVITASPLNHAGDIVPHVATTYVINAVNSHAVVEPYRVYLASLAAREAEEYAPAAP